jgi:diguanylate cyclase (GGDEF)-like protein/PAS domain S-box-containing protein
MPTSTETAGETDLAQRLVTLERENRLLQHAMSQLARIREQWTRALDELKETKARLKASNRFLDRLLHTAPLPVLVLTRPWGRILMANAAAEALAGVPPGGLVGRSALRILSPSARRGLTRRLAEAARAGGPAPVALTLGAPGAEPRHLELHGSAVKVAPGEPERLMVIAQDVTERRVAEECLRHQSLHDALTGLPNRLLFREHLKGAVTQSERYGHKVAVLFLDLDGFKYVNDAYGHDTGDELLREVAARLQGALRASDRVARFGGDEFAAILLGVRGAADVERIAQKVIAAVSAPYLLKGWLCNISASVGISLYPDDADALDALMKYADMAMYRVKAAGKSGYQFFTADMNREAARRMGTIARLQLALERGEIEVYYQPQLDIARRRIIAFEALMRWNDPEHGVVSPAEFIGFAEETGLINALGELVLRQACRQAVFWARGGVTGINMAVNLSARQFRHHDLIGLVGRVIEETGIDPATLVLEVTESTIVEDVEASRRICAGLCRLGVQLALDDFGTGYASMVFLKRLPFSKLKIDRQFVHDLENDAREVALSDAIIRMASALGLKVVAEGLETPGQLRLLEALKCDQAQGFYFAHPAPADDCGRLLALDRLTDAAIGVGSDGPHLPLLAWPEWGAALHEPA